MDTLKTAIVVVLLLAVLYGVYVTLNQPDQEIPDEIAWAQQQTMAPLELDLGNGDNGAGDVTVTLSDSEPWSSDVTGASAGKSDHAMAYEPVAVPPGAPPADFGASPQAAGPLSTVSAPKLIDSEGAAPASLAQAKGAYASQTSVEATQASAAVDAGNGYDAGITPQPPSSIPADSATSVYAAASPSAGAPTGGYGASADRATGDLSGNPQMVATTEPPVADSYQATPAESPTASASRIDGLIQAAQSQIEQGQYYEALLKLSFEYNAPGNSPEDNQKLQQWLDPLAGKVIYSKEHLIGAPYQLQPSETLQSVATKHSVPWQLLANINGLQNPDAAQPGMSLKVVPGPFHAEVDLVNHSLTLFAGRLYAGKFAITVNGNNAPQPGEYQVRDKQPGHSFYAGNAQTLAPQDPANPFGKVWIDLGENIAIHSTSDSAGQSERHGCISLAAQDANDLYGILSLGSKVIVR